MSTITDNDLKELKDLINSKFEQFDRKFEQMGSKINQLNEKIDNRYQLLDSKLNDMRVDIATLKEGQNGINKRLDNLDFIARSVIGGIILALFAGFAKMLYPNLFT
ncbi:hypothetical protein ACN4EE_17465 [Geminocystis sp. CENA526]|uniref:hypothetical protein n=1 Tax=Geminocystis sp. CENA526 TaxID=1355871 RepID=UPI003D70233C